MKKRRWLTIGLHLLAWVLYFLLPHIMRPSRDSGRSGRPSLPREDNNWIYFSILTNLLLVPIFYLNVYYFFPRLLRSKRYLQLVGVQVIAFLCHYYYGVGLSRMLLPEGAGRSRLFFALMGFLVTMSFAYGYFASMNARRLEALEKEREVERMKAELLFLRWQISPHFLFNILNNMVALARKKSAELEPMLIHLSGLMRYMLYEKGDAKVSLHKEAEYLQSFVELQRLRYRDIELEQDIVLPKDQEYYIEPMLLIPFVENAFKHGVDLIKQPVIRIGMRMVKDELQFEVVNKYKAAVTDNKDDASGIGLANVRRRLEHLYAGRYSLDIHIGELHQVLLKIALS